VNVKTADLKNNLSRYLTQIRHSGETLIVCDRNEPIATLSPLVRDKDVEWRRYREQALARAKKAGLTIDIPWRRPTRAAKPRVHPTMAPDGRADVRTIDLVRGGREY
jgi:antitoxin (DNA-binding transcriptional repressor) of toxin-antitoxin stability system